MIDRIVTKIEEANLAYRTGNAIMSDSDYDGLLEVLYSYDPENDIFNKVGIEIIDETRKSKLPIDMASMNKIRTIEEIKNWVRLKGINTNTEIVCTPKFDGLSLCQDEINTGTWTRGDGVYGQKSDEHYKLIQNHLYEDVYENGDPFGPIVFTHTYGEVIMSRKTFLDKYSLDTGTGDFANPRNLVAGLLNSKTVTEPLRDCQYIKYGGILKSKTVRGFTFENKSDILDTLNANQRVKTNYHTCKVSELTEELLIKLFHDWSVDYEIDGIILEVNNLDLQESLGRETSSNNPCYARAFKHDSFEQRAETTILEIEDNISKQGLIKPVAIIEPIKLDGVTVSRCTLNNYKFVKDNGLGVGARVVIKRSGMVIPKIIEVLETVEFTMPVIEGVELGWNEAGIELITLNQTEEQTIKQNIAFFEILDTDSVGEGVVRQLYDAGYKTIESILNITIKDLESIDRFGKRKATIVYNAIKKSVANVSLSKLQHATGLFIGLGSKKLILLEQFTSKPTFDEVMSIEGFAEISTKTYLDNYDKFFDFIKDLPITLEVKVESVKVGNDLEGMSFVFTGVRRTDLEEIIESRGGKIGSSVSKNTSHLVMKSKGSGSSKENKAIALGVKIFTVDELENMLS
jgi:DNA ligase (NAD+)